jgi:Cation transporter/ATPase, N-terminus
MARPSANHPELADAWWSLDAAALLQQLGSSPAGLTPANAEARLARDGPNAVTSADSSGTPRLLWRQPHPQE